MILVTGHLGFIGKHLTKALDENDLAWRGFDLLEGDDITDLFTCKEKMKGVRSVIHLAAKTGVPGGELDPKLYHETNVRGTKNLLIAAHSERIRHFIYFSSASIYGNCNPPAREVDAKHPTSYYGLTKKYAEMLVEIWKVPYTIVRPFNVYGENGRKEQVIYKWAEQARRGEAITIKGDGTSARGYTYVGDLVAGILNVVKHEPTNMAYNFGSETPITLNEVADLFSAERKYLPWPESEIYVSYANSLRAKEMFAFKPATDFMTKAKEILACLM